MPAKKKVPVTARALVQRIARRLAGSHQKLRTYRGSDVQLGRYYVVDARRNVLVEGAVDLEELGRRLEVLQGWEELRE